MLSFGEGWVFSVADNGTGWLVSETGVWVPVAYNASVTGDYDMKRASFVSFGGVRRTAGRGREPRTWEVTETVPYDWAQALSVLWSSDDSLRPMYWIPPLAAWSNYAQINFNGASQSALRLFHDAPSWVKPLSVEYQSEFFPVRHNMRVEFGGFLDGGMLRLRLFKSDMTSSAGVVSLTAVDMLTEVSREVAISNAEAVWGRLETTGDVNAVRDCFIRLADTGVQGVRKVGDGGCWVTLDDVRIKHSKLTTYNPLVDVFFTVTECERS